jgi:hypothetical protein
LILLIAVVAPRVSGQNKSRGSTPGVSLLLQSSGTYDSSADVTICGDALCTAKKSSTCNTLTAMSPGFTASETCGSGGGWKGYSYTIHVNGSSCSGILAVGTPTPVCTVSGESASLSAQ